MMRSRAPVWTAGAAFAVAILFAASAEAAPDPKAVADLLVADFAATGKATATYESATADGDTVTITGFMATQTERKGRTMGAATIVASGVADRQPGGYTAQRVTVTDGSMSYRGNTLSFRSGVIDNVVLITPDEIPKLSANYNPFTQAEVTGIAFSGPELKEPLNIDHVRLTSTVDGEGQPTHFQMDVGGIAIPASAIDSPEAQGVLQGLGYSDLVAAVAVDLDFDPAADLLTINAMTLDVADVGKLTIAGKLSRAKVRAMLASETKDGAGPAAKPVSPKLERLSIRIDNAGVVERALDMQAQLLGTTREDIAQQWPMLLMFQMGDTGGMDFQMKLQEAVATFLQSPKSLTVTLSPKEPVALDELEQVLAHDESKATELLGVDVVANQ